MKHSGTRHGERVRRGASARCRRPLQRPDDNTRRRRAHSTARTRHGARRGGFRPSPSWRTTAARTGAPAPPATRCCAPNPPSSGPAPKRRSDRRRRRRRRQRRPHQPPKRREVARAARRARRARSRASTLRSLCKQPLRGVLEHSRRSGASDEDAALVELAALHAAGCRRHAASAPH